MGDRLSSGVVAITFLINTVATGCAAVALMLALRPISGAHLNPAVSVAAWLRGQLPLAEAAEYVGAQLIGAFLGVGATLLVFGPPVFNWSNPPRATVTEIAGEVLAAFGLVLIVTAVERIGDLGRALAAGAHLTVIYWFTESTSFANPALTIAKGLTDTSSSIHPHDLGIILTAQLLGAASAGALFRWWIPPPRRRRTRLEVVFAGLPHEGLAPIAAGLFRDGALPGRVSVTAAAPFAGLPVDAAQGAEARPALTEALLERADILVTLGREGDWTALIGRDRVHWELPPLRERDAAHAAEVRQLVRARVRMLLRELGVERVRPAAGASSDRPAADFHEQEQT